MSKYIAVGDTLIAKHIDGHARKIIWKGAKKHPVTQKTMTLYECDWNAYVKITKEFEGELPQGTETYHKSLNDELEAYAISIYVQSLGKEKFEVKEGVSARHGASIIAFRKNTVSTVKATLASLVKSVTEKQNLLTSQEYLVNKKTE